MNKKFCLAILINITLLFTNLTRAYGLTHNQNTGFIHLRGELVNGTCVFSTQTPGMVIEFDRVKESDALCLSGDNKGCKRIFFLKSSDCLATVYKNLKIVFSGQTDATEMYLLGTALNHESLTESSASNVAIYDHQFQRIRLNSKPINLTLFDPINQRIQLAASLLPESITDHDSGSSSLATLRLLYP